MKRIIILLFLISYIFCSIKSCTRENDYEKCSIHDIEYKGFSCYKFNSDDGKYCSFHPDNSESQKVIFKLMNGLLKEAESGSENDEDKKKNIDDLENCYSEKESYNKGEVIVLKTEKISEEDKKIIMGKKTCRYLFEGRFYNIVNDETLMQNYKGHPDIEDKNTCFNAEQFPDLKDLLDCGYAEIKYTTESNKQYTLKTCYFIPNDKMPEEFGSYLKTEFINNDFEGVIPQMFNNIENYEMISQYSENRRLDANNCEIIVEDKNGKKVKYTPGSTDIEVIGNGNDQNNNNNSDNNNSNNNNNNNNKNNTNMLGLNIILLLSLILLNF